jgi:RNA polymerase sigma factor (sigma-70 family)
MMGKEGAMDNEDLLIKSIISGNTDSFKIIVEKYQGFIFAICLNIIKDPHEAENAAQETFLRIYRSLHQYEYKGFKTWIGRIATNISIDFKRKRNASNIVEISFNDEMDNTENLSQMSLYDEVIKGEDRKKILTLCGELPDIYKSVISKYYIQEMSYQNIAKVEGISIKTVESRLYRAKKMLKEKWEVGSNETL